VLKQYVRSELTIQFSFPLLDIRPASDAHQHKGTPLIIGNRSIANVLASLNTVSIQAMLQDTKGRKT
jgi:hypothetical protein